jgi:hypothetical protein
MTTPTIAEVAGKLSDAQWKIVLTGEPDTFRNFKHTAAVSGVPIEDVPDACRGLRAIGAMSFILNGWTDDGEIYGAGYGLTDGFGLMLRAYLQTLPATPAPQGE